MKYYYRSVPGPLKDYIGGFYLMKMPQAISDIVRVEIPHIRFLCRGESTLSHGDETGVFGAPDVLVCGPSFRTGHVSITPGTLIVGASLTPAGWHSLIGVSAEDLANKKTTLGDIRPDLERSQILDVLASETSDETLFDAAAAFLQDALRPDPPPRWDFIIPAVEWAIDPDSPGVQDLSHRTGLSARQVDRLCRYYFGGSPKKVHRVFRALNISYRLTIQGTEELRDVIGPYFDQSHFIRDFKSLIGCTPSAFRQERLFMMQFDLEQKNKVPDMSKYGLIG